MLVKVSTSGTSLADAGRKMNRALREFRIRGVKNNIQFLENLINHPVFISGRATVDFIQDHLEPFQMIPRLHRGTRILSFFKDVAVNGNPHAPSYNSEIAYPKGIKDKLKELGPEGFCQWLKNEKPIYYTERNGLK